jgi:type 1 glutamine amidotransferase
VLRRARGRCEDACSEVRMKSLRGGLVALVCTLLATGAWAQPARKRVLYIGQTKGFQHDTVPYAAGTLWKLGKETGLWETYIRTDCQLITKKKLTGNAKNLSFFDVVVFYTTGELDMDEEQKADLLSFIRDDGKGFLGIHSATDTFYKWPDYGEMIGGYFDHHPWNVFDAPLIVEDPEFPGMKHLPRAFTLKDEIYQVRDFSRERVRVLVRLDETKLDYSRPNIKRADKDFAVIWARNYGKGRVIYNGLGHVYEVWDNPDIQKMIVEHMKWLMGMISGDAAPRPRPAQ